MKWITIFAFAVTAAAQEQTFTTQARTFVMAEKMELEGKVVTGAPYTAEAVTETIQVLADGNRITRKTSSMVARDSQGRTRREQNLNTVGPWSSPESHAVVFINDPVAGVRYNVEPNAKTAVKLVMGSANAQERREIEDKLKRARMKEESEMIAMKRSAMPSEPKAAPVPELLGTRTIGGVVAEGKRVTEVIPAGKLGNERPIDVVNETWYSSELQIVVMSKHSDPRSGDVVYTLTNINRAEPDSSMFTVPSDYRVKEEQVFERRRP